MYTDEFEDKYFTAYTALFRRLALECIPGALPFCMTWCQFMHNILMLN